MITNWYITCYSYWTISSILLYILSVILIQILGALWYSEYMFGRIWIIDQLPENETPKTEDEWKRFWNKNLIFGIKRRHENIKYQSALFGTMILFYIYRGLLLVLLSSSNNYTLLVRIMNSIWIGFVLLLMKSIFGIMHPMFEERTMISYTIHCSYDIVSFMIGGAILSIQQI